MKYRRLGRTSVEISELSFGAGPVAGLMTDPAARSRQREIIQHAIAAGINWFDTAATYGDGQSETSLGAALRELDPNHRVHVATKVRLMPEDLRGIRDAVRRSVTGSLQRLGRDRVTLLQLHNAITPRHGELPTSLTPADVLGPGGVLEAFTELQREGLIEHVGLTGMGDALSLVEVIANGPWAAIQLCVNIVEPCIRLERSTDGTAETPGDDLASFCQKRGVGVIAIRVLAGGALAGHPPSAHTLKTRFFPLEMFERARVRAARIEELLPPGMGVAEAAIRHVANLDQVSTALIGFARPEQVDEAVRWIGLGRLDAETAARIDEMLGQPE
jgi:aryl-alcohol dehydrogenase-like predicted oxidoreductase